MDIGTEHTCVVLGDEAKSLEGRAAVLRDLSMEEWADRNVRKFRKHKCKVVHLRCSSPCHGTVWGVALQKRSWGS